MRRLIELKFGSHLYGTNTPTSDVDYKAVHLPDRREILLGRAKPVYTANSKVDQRTKNNADDVDYESYCLQKYLTLVAEGQTVALDMLFAPEWSWTCEPDPLWLEIQANRSRLLTRQYASFVGYCRTQANKYGIKGSRVAAARAAKTLLTDAMADLGTTAKLAVIASDLRSFVEMTEHGAMIEIPTPSGAAVTHFEVCGRKMPYTATIKSACEIMSRLVDEYGLRALQAESNRGVDWKALSHAVRIGRQAIEVLLTGNVVFPRPDAAHLLEIKTGRLDYQVVAEEIESLLVGIERASDESMLPDEPDHEWIEDFILRAHFLEVTANPVRKALMPDWNALS